MSVILGYAFRLRSQLSLAELLQLLRARTALEWIERDNDLWGEYVSAYVASPKAFIKVFPPEGDDRYNVDVKFLDNELEEPERAAKGFLRRFLDDVAESPWERASKRLLQQVLPQIEATDVERSTARID
jgi:hypothetical protein